MMHFFNVEIPDEDFPHYAYYVTVDQNGEIDAWNGRPTCGAVCWDASGVGTELGYTDDTDEWNTHWYALHDDGEWWYEPVEPQGRKDDFHWDTATQYTEGHKNDQAKLRYDLLPPKAVEHLTAVLTYGAAKYGANNWKQVPCAQDRYYAAALRHIQAWRQGELNDPESGLPHLAHAMCSLVFLLEGSDDAS